MFILAARNDRWIQMVAFISHYIQTRDHIASSSGDIMSKGKRVQTLATFADMPITVIQLDLCLH